MPAHSVGFLLYLLLGLRQTPCQRNITKSAALFCVRMLMTRHSSIFKKTQLIVNLLIIRP